MAWYFKRKVENLWRTKAFVMIFGCIYMYLSRQHEHFVALCIPSPTQKGLTDYRRVFFLNVWSKNAWICTFTPPPNTSSWRDAQLKHRENFTFFIYLNLSMRRSSNMYKYIEIILLCYIVR
jgi:hypothetical protein